MIRFDAKKPLQSYQIMLAALIVEQALGSDYGHDATSVAVLKAIKFEPELGTGELEGAQHAQHARLPQLQMLLLDQI